jgi:serine/threonine-protein kinase
MEKLGKYQLVEKIGVGGFGVVYKGIDPFIKRSVAIKTCSAEDKETRERFLREAEICGNLQHRNIVTVFEFGFEQETPYLVQEYLSGEDLDKKIKRRDTIPVSEKILWLVQIARGLEFAHARGIVHRDIKPANIRILEDGTAKILDFGIAKLAQQQSTLTQAGITLGTAAYLAPEQVRGESVDARSDVFSFGVLAFELIAYERPFHSKEISAIFFKILNEPAPRLPALVRDAPPDLLTIIDRCLQKDPAQRFSPTSDLVRALEKLMRQKVSDPSIEATRQHAASRMHDEMTAAVPATAKVAAVKASPPPPQPEAQRAGLHEVELSSYPEGAARPQSRAMATMAFGGEGKGKRWASVAALGAVALGLLAVALQFAGRGSSPQGQQTNRPPAKPGVVAPVDPGARPTESGTHPTDPGTRPAATPGSTRPVVPTPAPTAVPTPEPTPLPLGRLVLAEGWDQATAVSVAGRRVRLDREQTLELRPGTYDLEYSLETPSYSLAESARVVVRPGATARVEVPLKRPGRLTVQPHLNTRPGTVRLDGQMIGAAPVRGRWLPPGEHLIEIFPASSPGAEPSVRQTVAISSDQETVLTFDVDGKVELTTRTRPLGGG